jgi:hypothetical protein
MFNKFQLGTQASKYLAQTCSDKSAMLVLLKMMYRINKYNMVTGTPAQLAEQSGISIRDFNLGIRGLKKFDFVRKFTKREYMINPEVMFNGDDKQYYIVKHMWDTQTTRGLRA